MKKILKWMGFVVAGLAVIVSLLLAGVYFTSSRELDRVFTVADTATLTIPTDLAEIAEGHRVAQLAGCLHCHGDTLKGGLVDDIPNLVRLVAPNISTVLPKYSDAQLATVLRKGVKPDGKSVLFMPSEMFRHLSDRDLGRLIAYLRTVPVTLEGETQKTEVRVIGRVLIAKGDFKTAAQAIPLLPAAVTDGDDRIAHGRYLTMNFCSECHGQNLEGFAPIQAPPLNVVKGYSLEQFTRLMKEGVPVGDRELKLMGPTSRVRFANLTADEIAAVHAFLTTP